jgi:hypothetical protein
MRKNICKIPSGENPRVSCAIDSDSAFAFAFLVELKLRNTYDPSHFHALGLDGYMDKDKDKEGWYFMLSFYCYIMWPFKM